eukprot:sb/3465027/
MALANAASVLLPNSLENLDVRYTKRDDIDCVRLARLVSNLASLKKLGVITSVVFNSVECLANTLRNLPIQFIRFSTFSRRSPILVDGPINSVLSSISETLETLILSGSFLLDANSLPYLHNLKHLELFECDNLTEENLGVLLSKMPKLVSFHIEKCKQITGKCIAKSLNGNAIETIHIAKSYEFDNNTITDIIILTFSATLEKLILPFDYLQNRNLNQLPTFPKLAHLSLEGSYIRREPDFSSQFLTLLARMPNLQKLSCKDFRFSMMKSCIPIMMQMCPKIQDLDIYRICSDSATASDPGSDVFRRMSSVQNLSISISGPSTSFLSFCKSLKSLSLYNSDIQDSDLACIIFNLKHLRMLDLYSCKRLTKAFLELICSLGHCAPKLYIDYVSDSRDRFIVEPKFVPKFVVLCGNWFVYTE